MITADITWFEGQIKKLLVVSIPPMASQRVPLTELLRCQYNHHLPV